MNSKENLKPIIEKKLNCKILKKIGSGTFGSVYKVQNKNKQEFALKIETQTTNKNILKDEMLLYKNFKNIKGVPEIFWYGSIENKNILALELLGKTLDNLFEECGNTFTMKTVLMIAIQLIERIETIHTKNIIHRDLKPDNFMIGVGSLDKIIHIIDFGLSVQYKVDIDSNQTETNGKHIDYCKSNSFAGSLRYSSIRNHKGITQSRRDDLESIGYILIYFMKKKLPWQGLTEKDMKKRASEVYHIKRNTSLDVLCDGLPVAFFNYMKYCRLLQFKAEPNYRYLKTLFYNVFVQYDLKYDYQFDWIKPVIN